MSRASSLARSLFGRPSHFDLADRVVVVTGGARGLGLEIARLFVREGARVAICARTQLDIDIAVAELRMLESRRRHHRPIELATMGIVCDVTDKASVTAFVETVARRCGRIDALVNNAGVMTAGPLSEMTRFDFLHAMDTHAWGPLNMIEAALPHMRDRGGRIVNISSIGGKISVPHMLAYSASKFALTGLSTGLRSELARDCIYVTTVHPGLTRTGSPMNVSFKGNHRLEYAWFMLSDSLPLLSMDATRAARKIVDAMKEGRAEIVLSAPAKIAALAHAVAPNLLARAFEVANELLPDAKEEGRSSTRFGFQSESILVPRWLTKLTRSAEKRNNERVHEQAIAAALDHDARGANDVHLTS